MKTLYVLSIGVINITTGKTMYDWSIYEERPIGHVSLTQNGSLLYGSGGLTVGEEIELRGNDSKRLLGKDTIIDTCPAQKNILLPMLRKHGYDYRPIQPFQSRPKNNRKLKTSYSIK